MRASMGCRRQVAEDIMLWWCGDTKGSNVGGLFSLLGGLFSGLLVCLAGCLLHTLLGGISLLGGRAG